MTILDPVSNVLKNTSWSVREIAFSNSFKLKDAFEIRL